MGERGSCRSCGASILWVETSTGKKMPLDFEPERRFVIEASGGMLATLRNTYVSHFATCKFADQHRKPRET